MIQENKIGDLNPFASSFESNSHTPEKLHFDKYEGFFSRYCGIGADS